MTLAEMFCAEMVYRQFMGLAITINISCLGSEYMYFGSTNSDKGEKKEICLDANKTVYGSVAQIL